MNDRACATALVHLPKMTSSRLRKLLGLASPSVVWGHLVDGDLSSFLADAGAPGTSELVDGWRRETTEPDSLFEVYSSAGVGVWYLGGPYPGRLLDDPWAPGVLFFSGTATALDRPTAGIVGTRRCSAEGRENAFSFGAELGDAGVSVVSGLALGIDGAAHRGALSRAGSLPIGVVGSGLDVVYPWGNRELWEQVRSNGLLVSEAPLGARPEKWRFPARNRIIAGLSDVLVVVESNSSGGSLVTVKEAAMRDVPVLAVPGSINNRASVGTNELLRDGCAPACGVGDVIEAIGFERRSNIAVPGNASPEPVDDHGDGVVLATVRHRPTSTDEIVAASGLTLGEVIATLFRLVDLGVVSGDEGWWQRVRGTAG